MYIKKVPELFDQHSYDSGSGSMRKVTDFSLASFGKASAAVLIGALKGIATRAFPVNVTVLMPLYGNISGAASIKLGSKYD